MIHGSRVYRLSVKFDESGIARVSHTNPVNESACRPPFPAPHVLTGYPAL
jgi:hypothetical protein